MVKKMGTKVSKNAKASDEKTFVFVTIPSPDEKALEVWQFTNNGISKTEFEGSNLFTEATNYLSNLKSSNNLDGIIFDLYEHDDSKLLSKLRKDFIEFCQIQNIAFRFFNRKVLFTIMLLMISKIDFKLNTWIMLVYYYKEDFIVNQIKVGKKQFELGLKFEMHDPETIEMPTKFKELMKSCKPKAVIMGSSKDSSILNGLKNETPSEIPKINRYITDDFEECLVKCSSKLFNELLNVKDSRWNLLHRRLQDYEIKANYENGGDLRVFDSSTDIDDICPYKISTELPDEIVNLRVEQNENAEDFGYHIEYINDANELVFNVEEDGFINFDFPKRFETSLALEKKCIELIRILFKDTKENPFLVFNFGYIMLFAYENGKYNLDKQMAINDGIGFFKDKPVIGQEAKKMFKRNPFFVAYDLIEIMSKDPKDVNQRNDWSFKIIHTQDNEKPLLLKFETFDGTRKATPIFLFALILKNLAKIYKEKMGKKLNDVLLFNGGCDNGERINDQIIKAFELLNIQCKSFRG